jgi:hypothetical protein
MILSYRCFSFIFSDFPPQLAAFEDRVNCCVSTAYRPSTLGLNARLQWLWLFFASPFLFLFLTFLFPLSFLEFLHLSVLAVPTIKTYFSSIKARFRVASLPLQLFSSPSLALAFISLFSLLLNSLGSFSLVLLFLYILNKALPSLLPF